MKASSPFDIDSAINDYLSTKKSIAFIAEKYGYSYGWLHKHLKKSNIKIRGNSEWKLDYKKEKDACSDYKRGMLVKDIAKKYSVSRRTITDWLKRNDIKPMKLNERLGINDELKSKAIKLYNEDLLNCVEIAKIIGVSHRSIFEWVRGSKRSKSQISSILASKGKKKGYGKSGNLETRFGKLHYDSSYEMDRLIQLSKDENVIDLQRFKGFIKYEGKNYNPDFIIKYKCGCLVIEEVKPNFMLHNQMNISKFKAASKYCKERGLIFRVVTENQIYGK